MKALKASQPGAQRQRGLSYVEVLVAMALIAVSLIPALDALQTGILGAGVHESYAVEHYHVTAKTEEILAQPFGSLLSAAAAAGNPNTLSSYTEAAGTPNRRLVYLSFYDADNSDGDNDPFTIADANSDADNNPYTGSDVDISLLWVRVVIEATAQSMETLTSR